MKKNFPVTQVERPLMDTQNLISTTDTKGQITYANADFCEVAGFDLNELEGAPHNIVRHPDMPPEAFADLWKNLKNDLPWMGIVKNRCKNGDHYWVDAYVMPIRRDGETVEYQSVRTQADPARIARAEAIYQEIQAGRLPLKLRLPRLSLAWRLTLLACVGFLPLMIGVVARFDYAYLLGALILSLGIVLGGLQFCLRQCKELIKQARSVVDNPLMQLIYFGRVDDLSQVQLALKMQESQIRAVVARVLDSSTHAETLAAASNRSSESTRDNLSAQQQELEQVATAMNEMASTSQEIARSATAAAESAQRAREISGEGGQVVDDSIVAIKSLADQLQKAACLIRDLDQQGGRIDEVVNVIGSIAEQTNLLALNAAIEAARAGEQGRGFAVVADEVRALAKRTQDSTIEIQNVIRSIQQGTQKAVAFIAEGEELSKHCVDKSDLATQAFSEITEQINTMADMNYQIASAVEEQSAVIEEISARTNQIYDLIRDTSADGQQTAQMSQGVLGRMQQQLNLIRQFM